MTQLDALLQSVAREQDAACTLPLTRQRVRERLLSQQPRRVRRHPWRPVQLLAVAAAATLSVGAAFQWWATDIQPITVVDHRGTIDEGSWVSAVQGEEHPLRFSDGSTVALAPLSQARLVELRPNGAQVSLETGLANVAVVHRPSTQWQIVAGPFLVDVTGTRFEISWSPVRDRFELQLIEGRVVVKGCGFGEGRTIDAGQRVIGSCKSGRAEVVRGGQTPPEIAPSAGPPTCDSAPSVAAARAPQPPRSGQSTKELLSASTENELHPEQATADQLLQWGNAVRQEGKLKQARNLLVILRRRFAGSGQAGQAAFSLGLIDFDGFGKYAASADWFRAYLTEQPNGPLVREARGRLMEALFRSSNPEARSVAETYLRQSPTGPHAQLAHRILEQP